MSESDKHHISVNGGMNRDELALQFDRLMMQLDHLEYQVTRRIHEKISSEYGDPCCELQIIGADLEAVEAGIRSLERRIGGYIQMNGTKKTMQASRILRKNRTKADRHPNAGIHEVSEWTT